MAVGSISLQEFNSFATDLASVSKRIDDAWVLRTCPSDQSQVFLEKTCLEPALHTNSCPDQEDAEPEEMSQNCSSLEVEDRDPSCWLPPVEAARSCLRCTYHVIYSSSYGVPVLYFNICKPDGRRVSVEEVWQRVPAQYQSRMQQHRWATVTQQEHPYLGSPFFMLHPCHTGTLMTQVPQAHDKRYYLIKWLSSVGPVVNLKLPTAYATAWDNIDPT